MIFPSYDFDKKTIITGSIYPCSPFCMRKRERCANFYNGIKNNGIFTCPYGFSTISKGEIIATGIGITGYCDKNKIKRNGYTSKILSFNEANEIVNLVYEKNIIDRQFKTIEELILELFHDVRKVNGTTKNNCQELLDGIDENDPKKKALLNILDASNLISLRLDYYQFVVNPNTLIKNEKISIYRIYEKCIQAFKSTTQPRGINFNLGKYWKGVDGQRIINLVPYVILENAIKYAPNNSEISVSFVDANDNCTVTVSSLGPKVEANELDLIFRSGYRGIHALDKKNISGTGLGLSIVKDICDKHGFEVFARSVPQPLPNRHTDYYLFSVSVVFSKTYLLQE